MDTTNIYFKIMRAPFFVWLMVAAVCQNKNILFLILLIPLANLTNQKRGICRHCILYPLRLGPPFPNDARNLRPKASLEPNLTLN